MGQFANTLFSALLGWVQSAAAELWRLVTNTDVSAWMRWLLEHWQPLTLILCIGGAAVDWIIYLIRWQPYRMWRSFRRKDEETVQEAAEQEQAATGRKWLHADGSVTVEDPRELLHKEQRESLPAPVRPVRRAVGHTSPEQAYNQPYYPPQWQQTKEQGEER